MFVLKEVSLVKSQCKVKSFPQIYIHDIIIEKNLCF